MVKKSIKRLLQITICSILILTITTQANATNQTYSHWASIDIKNCVTLGLIEPTHIQSPDEPINTNDLTDMLKTAFSVQIDMPNNAITRQETANLIETNFGIDPTTIFKNYPDGSFKPEKNLTNAEVCTIVIRLIKQLSQIQPEQPDPVATQVLLDTKQKYPTGTLWGFSDTVGTNYYIDGDDTLNPTTDVGKLNFTLLNTHYNGLVRLPTNIKYACGGFAAMISDQIFGKTGYPCHEVFDTANARPGDIVYFMDDEGYTVHIAVIYNLFEVNNQTYFQTAGANEQEQVRYPDDIEKPFYQISKSIRVFTRYEN